MRSVLDRINFGICAIVILCGILPVYILIGLQPATATSGIASSQNLNIPSLQISSPVQQLTLEDNRLNTPDTIVGSYQQSPSTTLLIGHSSTVFQNLAQAQIGQSLQYGGETYLISGIATLAKSDISMRQVLKGRSQPTLILMTCAGEPTGDQDYSHRLMITAVKE